MEVGLTVTTSFKKQSVIQEAPKHALGRLHQRVWEKASEVAFTFLQVPVTGHHYREDTEVDCSLVWPSAAILICRRTQLQHWAHSAAFTLLTKRVTTTRFEAEMKLELRTDIPMLLCCFTHGNSSATKGNKEILVEDWKQHFFVISTAVFIICIHTGTHSPRRGTDSMVQVLWSILASL